MSRRYVFCATLLLAACSHNTPDQQLIEAADPAASWVATLQLAGENWLANSAPTSFVRATIGSALKAFDKTGKTIAQSQARRELREEIRRPLEVAQAAAGDLDHAIEKGDRRAAAEAVRRFAEASAALRHVQRQKAGE